MSSPLGSMTKFKCGSCENCASCITDALMHQLSGIGSECINADISGWDVARKLWINVDIPKVTAINGSTSQGYTLQIKIGSFPVRERKMLCDSVERSLKRFGKGDGIRKVKIIGKGANSLLTITTTEPSEKINDVERDKSQATSITVKNPGSLSRMATRNNGSLDDLSPDTVPNMTNQEKSKAEATREAFKADDCRAQVSVIPLDKTSVERNPSEPSREFPEGSEMLDLDPSNPTRYPLISQAFQQLIKQHHDQLRASGEECDLTSTIMAIHKSLTNKSVKDMVNPQKNFDMDEGDYAILNQMLTKVIDKHCDPVLTHHPAIDSVETMITMLNQSGTGPVNDIRADIDYTAALLDRLSLGNVDSIEKLFQYACNPSESSCFARKAALLQKPISTSREPEGPTKALDQNNNTASSAFCRFRTSEQQPTVPQGQKLVCTTTSCQRKFVKAVFQNWIHGDASANRVEYPADFAAKQIHPGYVFQTTRSTVKLDNLIQYSDDCVPADDDHLLLYRMYGIRLPFEYLTTSTSKTSAEYNDFSSK
ncbi:hypothetical protein EDC01DRAFT_634158 [Geopyxis carbonaria]|nr:hypothetical protein EDC01DRAFT_634158 [Geopyxis carbonaria]